MVKYKWYRKWKRGTWYKHENTYQLPGLAFSYYWARYVEVSRYTRVIKTEHYG